MPQLYTPLSFDVSKPHIRSPQEEWRPHARMSEKSFEWWYVTLHAFDASGRRYFLFFDIVHYPGDGWHTRFGVPFEEGKRFAHLVGMVSDYERQDYRTLRTEGLISDQQIWDADRRAVLTRLGESSADWSYTDQGMQLRAEVGDTRLDLRFSETDEVIWHQDKLGVKGLIQQGAEDDFSFYYSIMRAAAHGTLSLQETDGSWRTLQIAGQAWIDRQWGDFFTLTWEWSSFRFDNGARFHLYNFYNGHQEAVYVTADGEVRYLDGVVVKQNGYAKAPDVGTWVSWGWSYELPVEVEGSRRFRVEPLSSREFLEIPEIRYALYEGGGRLIDETSGRQVGVSVNESADIRIMQNAPYASRQR